MSPEVKAALDWFRAYKAKYPDGTCVSHCAACTQSNPDNQWHCYFPLINRLGHFDYGCAFGATPKAAIVEAHKEAQDALQFYCIYCRDKDTPMAPEDKHCVFCHGGE